MKTIIGLFDDQTHATQAQNEVVALGIPREHTAVLQQTTFQPKSGGDQSNVRSWWEQLKQALGFGFSEDEGAYYQEGLQRGGTLLSVRAAEAQYGRIIDVMNRHDAVDIDERAAEWKRSGWTPLGDEMRVPVVEEELRIGKREMQRGGVRIYSHVQTMPVEEQIQLRDERVKVERRPTDRPVAAGEAAFQEEAVEISEAHEEPVVSKSPRVKEEVVVKKDRAERTETVRDTVRRKEVKVDQEGDSTRKAG